MDHQLADTPPQTLLECYIRAGIKPSAMWSHLPPEQIEEMEPKEDPKLEADFLKDVIGNIVVLRIDRNGEPFDKFYFPDNLSCKKFQTLLSNHLLNCTDIQMQGYASGDEARMYLELPVHRMTEDEQQAAVANITAFNALLVEYMQAKGAKIVERALPSGWSILSPEYKEALRAVDTLMKGPTSNERLTIELLSSSTLDSSSGTLVIRCQDAEIATELSSLLRIQYRASISGMLNMTSCNPTILKDSIHLPPEIGGWLGGFLEKHDVTIPQAESPIRIAGNSVPRRIRFEP